MIRQFLRSSSNSYKKALAAINASDEQPSPPAPEDEDLIVNDSDTEDEDYEDDGSNTSSDDDEDESKSEEDADEDVLIVSSSFEKFSVLATHVMSSSQLSPRRSNSRFVLYLQCDLCMYSLLLHIKPF